jgi:hypothetical protein
VSSPQISSSQEKDADIAAAEWVLGGVDDSNDPRYIKRLLGIVLAFVLPKLTVYGFDCAGGQVGVEVG